MRALVISAHPDDETLGCGGTLLKHRTAGDQVYWMIATQTHEPQWSEEVIERKRAEVERVAEVYGIEQYFGLEFPSACLDTVPLQDIIQSTEKVISQVRPELVYLVHGGDIHTDHQTVFTAAISVLKPAYMPRLGVRRVLCYETLSSTESAPQHADRVFLPNVFSEITQYIDRKLEIMELYESEAQADPLPRGPSAIRSLARFRGATVGVEYAEAFMLLRELT